MFTDKGAMMNGGTAYQPTKSGYYQDTNIYAYLTTGDGYSKLASTVQDRIVTVKKWTAFCVGRDLGENFAENIQTSWSSTDEKFFLLSVLETTNLPSHIGQNHALGSSGDEQYLGMKQLSGEEDDTWLRDLIRIGGDGTYGRGSWAAGKYRSLWSYDSIPILPAFCF